MILSKIMFMIQCPLNLINLETEDKKIESDVVCMIIIQNNRQSR